MEKAIQTILDAVKRYGFDRKAYQELGMINVQTDEENKLLIFNYSKECGHNSDWNEVELVCRGLIIDASDIDNPKVIGRAFDKFFNLEQAEETKLVNLPPEDEIDSVTFKEDGSMGFTYMIPNGFGTVKIATRGSFNSEQAIWATEEFNRIRKQTPDYLNLQSMDRLLKTTSLIFEIIYPENRVVLDYRGEKKLVLIGARDLETGEEWQWLDVDWLAQQRGFQRYKNAYTISIQDLINRSKTEKGIEGWVIRYKNGLRVKLKTDEYIALHRLVSNLTPKHVKELLMQENGMELFQDFMFGLPDEFGQEARRYEEKLTTKFNEIYWHVFDAYQEVLDKLSGNLLWITDGVESKITRKIVAETIIETCPEYKSILFAIHDGKDIRNLIWKRIDVNKLFGTNKVPELEN